MQRAGAIDYGSSTIRNTDKARGRSNEPLPPDAMQFSCGLTAWQMLARVPKRSRHPNKFVEKFVHASGVSGIGNFARSGIEKPPRGTEINVRENRDQSQLPQHWHQALDHARAAEWTG